MNMLPKLKILLLIALNFFSSVGYSLIAPLYPIIAKSIGLSDDIVAIEFSVYPIVVCLTIIFSNKILKLMSRKRLFVLSLCLESMSVISFGMLIYVNDVRLFITLSTVLRFIQGFASALTAILIYSIASSYCDETNIKIVIGYMELAYCGGVAGGPFIASLFYYLGGYMLPFLVSGGIYLLFTILVFFFHIEEDKVYQEVNLIYLLITDPKILINFLTIVVDMIATTFFLPIFTEYLQSKYGFSMEIASLFLAINMTAYIIVLPIINHFTKTFGLKYTLFTGLLMNTLSVLMIAPIKPFSQDYYMIIIGLFILGAGGAFITLPVYGDFLSHLKNGLKYDSNTAEDLASSFFNLGINVGDAIGPIFGVFTMTNGIFDKSCIATSIFSGSFAFANFFFLTGLEIVTNFCNLARV